MEYLNPNTLVIFLPFHLCRKTNRRHNTISEFLSNNIFISISINRDNFKQSINSRITRWKFNQFRTIREEMVPKSIFEISEGNFKEFRKTFQIIGLGTVSCGSDEGGKGNGWFCLSVEDCCHCYFVAAYFVANLFEATLTG